MCIEEFLDVGRSVQATDGARGGTAVARGVRVLLMSYVCDAETPKLAHAIVCGAQCTYAYILYNVFVCNNEI